jgi:anti-sigma regulatory factor (Ser/Thr protein kinase)
MWFRRDLRAFDNAALFHALKSCKHVHCVFVFDAAILDKLPRQDRRVEFIRESLVALDAELHAVAGQAGAGLIVRHAWAAEEVPRLAHELGVQEVFANILKHAGRCRVRLQAQATPAGVSLITITDDGRGLSAAPKEGVGLPSMRERAQRLGAGLAIGPGEHGGCRVTLSLPASVQAASALMPSVDQRSASRNWLARIGK